MKRIITTIGALIVILVAGVGLFSVLLKAPSAFQKAAVSLSSAFRPAEAELELDVKSNKIAADRPFVIETNKGKEGVYYVSYPCQPGVLVKLDRNNVADCDTPTAIAPNLDGSLELSIDSKTERFMDVPLTVSFTDSETQRIYRDDLQLTITNAAVTESSEEIRTVAATDDNTNINEVKELDTVAEPKPVQEVATTLSTPPSVPADTANILATTKPSEVVSEPQRIERIKYKTITIPRESTSNPNGIADLVPQVVGIGIINEQGAIVETTSFTSNDKLAVIFKVTNQGNKVVNTPWSVSVGNGERGIAMLENNDILYPDGSAVEFNLAFDAKDIEIVNGIADITFSVDNASTVSESNEINNYVTTQFAIS